MFYINNVFKHFYFVKFFIHNKPLNRCKIFIILNCVLYILFNF